MSEIVVYGQQKSLLSQIERRTVTVQELYGDLGNLQLGKLRFNY